MGFAEDHADQGFTTSAIFSLPIANVLGRVKDRLAFNQRPVLTGGRIDKHPQRPESSVEWLPGQDVVPMRQGQALTEIPFVFVGPNNSLSSVDRPPLEDLVDVNLSHFRTSADLENGRHWTGVTTPVLAGFKFEAGQEVRLGSSSDLTTDRGGCQGRRLRSGWRQ